MNLFTEKLPFVPPEKLFLALKNRRSFIWLDTALKNIENRYSLIAFEPFLILKSKRDKVIIEEKAGIKNYSGDPLIYLDELLKRYPLPSKTFFCPGALGYFSYDLGWQIEKLPDIAIDDLDIPDICLGFYDAVLVIDHKEKCLSIVSMDKPSLTEKKGIIKKISDTPLEIEKSPIEIKKVSSNMSYNQYIDAIEKIKEYIANGDVYQINFAQRIEAEGVFPPETIYTKIRKVNPTSFSGYFNTGDFYLLSNSPELFLKKQGMKVYTKPMKGTRPRGKTKEEDERYRKELIKSIKEKAELLMIVDMERNDLGKVCRYGTVKVPGLRQIERYKTVFQATSLIEGDIRKNKGVVDLLRASFPGGSITGAPKVRAMEIIEELEPHKRAFYTGSMGYIGFNGNIELNILIRTILLKGKKLYYPVGGGIVWDSKPSAEYKETLTKAKALFLTLGGTYENLLHI
ncbi:MAG: aminodeoxychorismate synthase component I [Candidatus Omnitrophica bacterium]|nr:aminodeoxychorismate synthase component I [Candidatus Omnitrophota bacterium]MCM8777602.1 aminodeoxychorismate synthase component I [Candidatus Omnitrophota bacterium]